jgi:hypothetical protein
MVRRIVVNLAEDDDHRIARLRRDILRRDGAIGDDGMPCQGGRKQHARNHPAPRRGSISRQTRSEYLARPVPPHCP